MSVFSWHFRVLKNFDQEITGVVALCGASIAVRKALQILPHFSRGVLHNTAYAATKETVT